MLLRQLHCAAALQALAFAASATLAAAVNASVLECFQVAQPVLTPNGASYQSIANDGTATTAEATGTQAQASCSAILMDHVFAWSYGKPFIGNYTPPSCSFDRVVMNFTVVSEGRQFDRLALMYLNDTEVWRTSTAEPTLHPGIRWTYTKDMTQYLSLWKTPQTLIFDLGNLVDSTYTGTFNATLTATFFSSSAQTGHAPPADAIIPISARKSNAGAASQFVLPGDNATNTISFPRNANRAVFSVSANGQANEEFWWSNVLQSDVNTFNATAGTATGLSPFREVQLLIDGQLAGVQWPFPVIFTGGVVPSLHRPIVGLDAFDLREHEIDITPWLPVLCDGAQHTFTIVVGGLNDDGKSTASLTASVNDSWFVTGKIFVWLDDADSVTTGSPPSLDNGAPTITISRAVTQNSTGSNQTLVNNISVLRSFSVKGTVKSQLQNGEAVWSQTLSYSNLALVNDFGFNQINNFSITGLDTAMVPGVSTYRTSYNFPLYANTTTIVDPVQGNLTLAARLIQGLNLQVEGSSVFPTGLEPFAALPRTSNTRFSGALLATYRDGSAFFFQSGDKQSSTGFGNTNQLFHFGGYSAAGMLGNTPDTELYFRNVTAVNGTVTHSSERLAGAAAGDYSLSPDEDLSGAGVQVQFAQAPLGGTGPRAFMGRASASAAGTSSGDFTGGGIGAPQFPMIPIGEM